MKKINLYSKSVLGQKIIVNTKKTESKISSLKMLLSIASLLLAALMSSCGSGSDNGFKSNTNALNSTQTNPNSGAQPATPSLPVANQPTDGSPNSPNAGGDSTGINYDVQIQTKIDFSGLSWPQNFDQKDANAIALALNISGSFEGADEWANISDNFDNMGLSLGLLNQNLGQGSLQPLMMKMLQDHSDVMKSFFTTDHYDLLSQMLAQWNKGSRNFVPKTLSLSTVFESNTDNSNSVVWARKNLYNSSGKFQYQWLNELTSMARSREYRQIQFNESLKLHDQAVYYMNVMNLHELRAYLFFFDIIVQTGGFSGVEQNEFSAYIKQNPKSSSTDRLNKLLDIKASRVLVQYIQDVRSRKQTIIDGHGIVHQESRNLEKEYGFSRLSIYK